MAQFGSALEWGSRGRRFESGRPDHDNPLNQKGAIGEKIVANKEGQNNSQMKGRRGSERRAFPRLKRHVIVQFRIKELPQVKELQIVLRPPADITRTRNLAEKGMFFTTSNELSPETILDIKISLPISSESIELQGRVVSCEEITKNLIYGIGVEFINLKDEQRKTLQAFVQFFLEDKGRKKWRE